ncbi:hypothetical protein KJ684_01945 [Patescibacteria group bacterium]|nr:hypothetical protein [Patescibacteria group bacterium]
MQKIKESSRIKLIENKWKGSIEDLLYNLHWKENLRHREISNKLNIPKGTITRWFRQLNVPTQDRKRFTNNNLLYFGTNQRLRKLKPAKKPKQRISVNEDFFKKWSSEMAYILGYFTADGCMFINPRGSHYISFYSTDRELIVKTRNILCSKHKIGYRKRGGNWKDAHVLQIGSKKMFNDLIKIGLMPNKTEKIKLPSIPKIYFSHFLRGYFDGDGCISYGLYDRKNRNSKNFIITTRFSSCNILFLKELWNVIKTNSRVSGGGINKKNRGYDLVFSKNDSFKIFNYMYNNIKKDYFLERKYNKFIKAFDLRTRSSIG